MYKLLRGQPYTSSYSLSVLAEPEWQGGSHSNALRTECHIRTLGHICHCLLLGSVPKIQYPPPFFLCR